MGGARSFRELKVYQAARDAAGRIFAMTKRFPREERYSLTDQIRKSSRAVKAMIAEALARRRYKAAFDRADGFINTGLPLITAPSCARTRNLYSPITSHHSHSATSLI